MEDISHFQVHAESGLEDENSDVIVGEIEKNEIVVSGPLTTEE